MSASGDARKDFIFDDSEMVFADDLGLFQIRKVLPIPGIRFCLNASINNCHSSGNQEDRENLKDKKKVESLSRYLTGFNLTFGAQLENVPCTISPSNTNSS